MKSLRLYIFIFVSSLLLKSCCTLVHSRTRKINIYSESKPVRFYIKNDTSQEYQTPVSIRVKRSENDLEVVRKVNKTKDTITVKSKLSATFWVGNLFAGGLIAYSIDLTNDKRFSYPSTIILDTVHTGSSASTHLSTFNGIKKYKTILKPEQGLFNIKISIPEGNHFLINKRDQYGTSFGFLGISLGAEYYLTNKYALSADIGALTNFMVPFPAAVTQIAPRESASAIYSNIQLCSYYRKLQYGAGLQFNRTFFKQFDSLPFNPNQIRKDTITISKNHNNLGFCFSTSYRLSNSFSLGLNYYPSFLGWDQAGPEIKYSHILFFELLFKIRTNHPRIRKNRTNQVKSNSN
jgi:hypothetical protein